MIMRIDPLIKSYHGYILKGSRALELIMDNKTPKVDLLVRESIQNSADATLGSSDCCHIKFDTKSFINKKLVSFIDDFDQRLLDKFGGGESKALVISDRFTTGLLGEPEETPGKPNNLYKLVYAFLESDKGENSGGSWGIGKSVYYRYGQGIVFYYSSTIEEGVQKHKLVGALLEDEKSPDRIISNVDKYCGVAFIGDWKSEPGGESRSIPVTDVSFINDFLEVFGLKVYGDGETGTSIIIPYFDPNSLLGDKVSEEPAPWDDDFNDNLAMSVQRWYFPRLNNYSIKKRIEVFVNGSKVELIPFFDTLQKLYNGILPGADKCDIVANNFDIEHNLLGVFRYKKMNKTELDVLCAPNNYPSPYCLLDIREDNDETTNEAIVFYARKPRMIVTYDDSKRFTTLKSSLDEYIIGVFKLNDNARSHGDYLGEYFKESENANHKGWEDIKGSKKAPHISSLKSRPFSTITKKIGSELREKFGVSVPDEGIVKNTKLQKQLGMLLLPPEDFGKDKEPTIKKGTKKDKEPLGTLKKEKRIRNIDTGFSDGCPTYSLQVYLKNGEQFILRTVVQTSTRSYSFEEWDEMDFVLPCYIKTLQIDQYSFESHVFNTYITRNYDDPNEGSNIVQKDGIGGSIFKVIKLETTRSKKVYGFKIINMTSGDFKINIDIVIRPLDETSCFGFTHTIAKVGGDYNG